MQCQFEHLHLCHMHQMPPNSQGHPALSHHLESAQAASAAVSCRFAAPLRMSDTVGPPAVTGPAATALWALMAERTGKPRGAALILPPAGISISFSVNAWTL
jgi:hypothetical protein